MQRGNSLENTLMLEKIEGKGEEVTGWDGGMASVTQWTYIWANSGTQWRTREPGMLQSMGSQRLGHNWVTEQQQLSSNDNWNIVQLTLEQLGLQAQTPPRQLKIRLQLVLCIHGSASVDSTNCGSCSTYSLKKICILSGPAYFKPV